MSYLAYRKERSGGPYRLIGRAKTFREAAEICDEDHRLGGDPDYYICYSEDEKEENNE